MTKLNVNGKVYELEIESHEKLAKVLRDKLGLRGVRVSCQEGECGSCTVLLDGKPVTSCIMLAMQAEGKEITTIEGLAKEGKLHPIQQAFIDYHGLACGHCTPAMILCAYALLNSNHNPTEEDVKKAISGVICRCTGYVKITKSIMAAAKELKKQEVE